MLIDTNRNKVTPKEIFEKFPGAAEDFKLMLYELDLLPVVFFVTGSVADGNKIPNDLDLFTANTIENSEWLLKHNFKRVPNLYNDDDNISSTIRREFLGRIHIDIQIIKQGFLVKKFYLMQSFHIIMKLVEIDDDDNPKIIKKIILQLLSGLQSK